MIFAKESKHFTPGTIPSTAIAEAKKNKEILKKRLDTCIRSDAPLICQRDTLSSEGAFRSQDLKTAR